MSTQQGIEKFEFKPDTVSEEFEQYIFRFKMFLRANNFNFAGSHDDAVEAGATLMAFGGLHIYSVLRAKKKCDELETMTFQQMVTILEEKYLVRDEKVAYCKFMKRAYDPTKETFDDFVTSLRILAASAGYNSEKEVLFTLMIRDSVPKHIQKQAKKPDTTLDSLLKWIVTKDHQNDVDEPLSVNKIENRYSRPRFNSESSISNKNPSQNKCDNCAFANNNNHAENCPAKNEICRFCKNKGHFERCCRKKKKEQATSSSQKHGKPSKHTNSYSVLENDQIATVTVNSINSKPSCEIELETGETVKFLPDSGSGANIMTKTSIKQLKNQPILRPSHRKLMPYKPKSKPLVLLGEFSIKARALNGNKVIDITIVVVDNEDDHIDNLLGIKTLRKLGVDFNELFENESL